MTVRITVADLGPLTRLDSGGQGVVFAAPRLRMQYASSLVFKQYKPNVAESLDVSVLESMPTYLESLAFAAGWELLSQSAWPCRLVDDGTRIIGFVMPSIPDAFFVQMKKSSGMSRELAEFQHLLNDESFLARRQIGLTDRHRYELLREVARALSVFHRHGIAVGDLSPKNLLFAYDPDPAVYFIDCDAMRFQGGSVMTQIETPSWEVRTVNDGEELGTAASDSYKLGLLALRLLTGSQDTRDPARLPKSVKADIRQLIVAALSADANHRPKPDDWIAPLEAAAATASTEPPRARQAAATTPTMAGATATATPTMAGSAVRSVVTSTPALTPALRPSQQTSVTSSSTPPKRRKRRRRNVLIGAIGIPVVAGGAILTYFLLQTTVPGAPANPIAVSSNGSTLASAGHSIYLWDAATGRIIATLTGPQAQETTQLAFSPDGKMLGTTNNVNSDIYLWDVATRHVVATFSDGAVGLSDPAFSPDGKTLAAADSDNKIYLWDVVTHRLITTIQTLPVKAAIGGGTDTGQITGIAFSPDGRTVAVTFFGGTSGYQNEPGGELCDVATRRIVAEFPTNDTGDGVVFSGDGNTVVIEESGAYILWDVAKKAVGLTLNDPSANASTWHPAGDAAAYSPDGEILATADGSPNDSAYLWDLATGQMTATLTDPNSQGVGGLAYIQGGKTLAVADGNGNIYLWDVATGRVTATLTDPRS